MLKTSGFALGFHHFPRNLAEVNEWKIMFYSSIEKVCVIYFFLLPELSTFVDLDPFEKNWVVFKQNVSKRI